jgi:hypothetical protein
MKKRYHLPLLQRAFFLFISLFLQNCGGLVSPPIQGEQEPTETIEQEGQVSQESNSVPTIMPELWQEIFSYLDFEGVLAARSVNGDWNRLITGFRGAGIIGVENKPTHIIDARSWVKRREINFRSNKLKELTPATIPSFSFCHLMGHALNLPQRFWPYLKRTKMHTLHLWQSQIGAAEARELAKALPGTQVHTLNLWYNQIGAQGAIELAKVLPATQMRTLHLGYNEIGAQGAIELAKVLPGTQVHTFYLGDNLIGDTGALELAKALPATQVHMVDLAGNQIGDAGALELAKALPATQVHILSLENNQIGDQGAIELAKALPATQVHTLHLGGNQIRDATRQLLMKQYPHIRWDF